LTASKELRKLLCGLGLSQEINTIVASLTTLNFFHQNAGNVAVISGKYGEGKTELVLVIAQRLPQDFPDGQLIISFDNAPPQRWAM